MLRLIMPVIFGGILLVGCEPPPSVQKVIEQEQAKEEAAKPRLENPAQIAAQEAGKEYYDIRLIGQWAPEGLCENEGNSWVLAKNSFKPPRGQTCRLEVVEELQNGSYAVAGFCPRLEFNEPTVFTVTLTGADSMILNAERGGGPLARCQ